MTSEIVRSQAPDLSVMMNYEYEADLDGDNALAYTVGFVAPNTKTLEVGAGSGMITKHLAGLKSCDIVALEINPASVERLKNYTQKIYPADLNDVAWTDQLTAEGPFDTIIAADVLEHLVDPWRTLRDMTKLLSTDGSIIISLPHVGHSALLACLLEEDFEYREWGLLDKTHIRFFGLHNILALHDSANLRVIDARFVIRTPEETEFSDRWARLPRATKNALLSNPYGLIYQVVTRAVRADATHDDFDFFGAASNRMPARSLKDRLLSKLRM